MTRFSLFTPRSHRILLALAPLFIILAFSSATSAQVK